MKRKQKQDEEAQYMYRCRMCNKVYTDCSSGISRTYERLIDAIYKTYVDNQPPLSMVGVHICKQTKTRVIKAGISDFIGFQIK